MSVLTRRRPAAHATRSPSRPVSVPAPRAADASDVDSVREAIRGTTRRTVVRTGAWSVPVVAAAMSAPAFAASQTFCSACNGALPVRCTVNVVVGNPITGPCNCSTGLVCATVGPLNLANVCVATGLASTQCGPTTCTGICVAAGGSLIAAVNVLVATLTPLIAALSLAGCNAAITGFIPGNICVVPVTNVNAGSFGALCITNTGTGAIGGSASAAVTTLKSTVAALGIAGLAFADQCASPYSCKPGVRALAQNANGNGSCAGGQRLDLDVGFCQC